MGLPHRLAVQHGEAAAIESEYLSKGVELHRIVAVPNALLRVADTGFASR
jgi:hypothetical protein